jgi:plasmid stabilization system protein ParE
MSRLKLFLQSIAKHEGHLYASRVEGPRRHSQLSPANFPTLIDSFERRIQSIVARLSKWPESAPLTVERPGLRAASLVRYPYQIFYRVTDEAIEIIPIRHTSRRQLDEDS